MNRILPTLLAAGFLVLTSQPGLCAAREPEGEPWEKVSFDAGVFISDLDSSFRLGSGVGISIDPERLLGLDSTNTVFRADGMWRFTDDLRHRLDFSWFALRRSGSSNLGRDITLEDPETGEPIEIPAGTEISGGLDLDIYQLAYSYSFFQDARADLAAVLGLYVLPIDVGFSATGFIEDSASARFTAPLPVVGLRMDFLLAPKWYLRTGSQVFYLEYKQFRGSLLSFRGAVEYNPWQHVGLGLGFDSLQFRLEAQGEDYPSIDFRGNLEFSYVGLQLYGRVFF